MKIQFVKLIMNIEIKIPFLVFCQLSFHVLYLGEDGVRLFKSKLEEKVDIRFTEC